MGGAQGNTQPAEDIEDIEHVCDSLRFGLLVSKRASVIIMHVIISHLCM